MNEQHVPVVLHACARRMLTVQREIKPSVKWRNRKEVDASCLVGSAYPKLGNIRSFNESCPSFIWAGERESSRTAGCLHFNVRSGRL